MSNIKQVFNPFLPINEYIPDGEPHVFGDRVYHYGSHDKEGGYTFCMLDYVCYSAPVSDLSDWRYEGVIYKAINDPDYDSQPYMYAPDVVKGNDGKYYLFYCTGGDYGYGGYKGAIKVAVCDSPAGEYKYLGKIRHSDGSVMERYICFDPAVINDNGVIRVYYGTQYDYEERPEFTLDDELINEEVKMFDRTKEDILSYEDSIMGPVMLTLMDDMLTVKDEPKHIIPYRVKGTSFESHPFFEGSSMRKVGEKYYFIYSSWQNHELCYAISDKPDADFIYGGTIVSNGDIGYMGRSEKQRLNMTGTTHGSICEIAGQWYVFYHRLTHKSDYSRQACAERITIDETGAIKQVPVTSCGLNGGPLKAGYKYPAVIACNITNGNMPHGSNSIYSHSFPNVTHRDDDRFVGEISDETTLGYKYIDMTDATKVSLTLREETSNTKAVYEGPLRLDERCEIWAKENSSSKKDETNLSMDICIYAAPLGADCISEGVIPSKAILIGKCSISSVGEAWKELFIQIENINKLQGVHALYLYFRGCGYVQLKEIGVL